MPSRVETASVGAFFDRRDRVSHGQDRDIPLTAAPATGKMPLLRLGAIAQLGERLHGMQEVVGSIPTSSTKLLKGRPVGRPYTFSEVPSPSSRGLGHSPFTAVTGVRIPMGTPSKQKNPASSRVFCGRHHGDSSCLSPESP